MHRGIILQTQVAIQVARATNAISYQVATQVMLRNRGAIFAALADRQVCILPDSLVLALGIPTAARAVMISARTQQHILERRALVSNVDANLAAHRLAEALDNPRFLTRQRTPGVFEIVGVVPENGRHVLVALKLVSATKASTGHDEWWISTAYPFGTRKIKEFSGAGRLIDLQPTVTVGLAKA